MSKGSRPRVMWSEDYAAKHDEILKKTYQPVVDAVECKAREQAIKDMIKADGRWICPKCGMILTNYKEAKEHGDVKVFNL